MHDAVRNAGGIRYIAMGESDPRGVGERVVAVCVGFARGWHTLNRQ